MKDKMLADQFTEIMAATKDKTALRDLFAAHAAAGILARRAMMPEDVAEDAYSVADAMLRARRG